MNLTLCLVNERGDETSKSKQDSWKVIGKKYKGKQWQVRTFSIQESMGWI